MNVPVIVAAHEVELRSYLGLKQAWTLTVEQTGGAFSLVEASGGEGTEPPMHYHEEAEEFFYVIDGDMTFKVGEQVKRVGDG